MALRPSAQPSQPGRALELGFEIGGCILIGLAIGYYLDRWLDTSPALLFVFMAFGFAAAVRVMIRFMKQAQMQQDDAAGSKEPGPEA